jgi:hypothetical protein
MHTPNLSAHVLVAAGVGAPVGDGEAGAAGVVALVGNRDVLPEAEGACAGVDDHATTVTTTVPAGRRMASAPEMTPIRRRTRRMGEAWPAAPDSSIGSRCGDVMLGSPEWWGAVDHLSGWFQ